MKRNHRRICRTIAFIIGMLSALMFCFTRYLVDNSTGLDSFLYTLGAGIQGTNPMLIVRAALPYVPVALMFALLFVLMYRPFRNKYGKAACAYLTFVFVFQAVLCPVASLIYMDEMLNVRKYISNESTLIYEEYYVPPTEVTVIPPEKPKNLVFIWLESMENTYADAGHGGFQKDNVIPRLTGLADENIGFAGLKAAPYAQYTFGAMFASACATPYAYSLRRNVKLQEVPAQNVPFFWDVLKDNGYRSEYVCGTDSEFAGTARLLAGHGTDKIYDLSDARANGIVPENYYVNWGIEDYRVFDIAKAELSELSQCEGPFFFMLSTMDTHYPVGYRCEKCGNGYDSETANIIDCADRQVTEFVAWLSEQEYYDDTVVFILGDHPRMDAELVKGVPYEERTMYNCLINADVQTADRDRIWTMFDVYPTLLAALGFTVEGERLGFGTNLFSGEETLPEKLGYDYFSSEIQKKSEFFLKYMQ